jgi:hypothetical protein
MATARGPMTWDPEPALRQLTGQSSMNAPTRNWQMLYTGRPRAIQTTAVALYARKATMKGLALS